MAQNQSASHFRSVPITGFPPSRPHRRRFLSQFLQTFARLSKANLEVRFPCVNGPRKTSSPDPHLHWKNRESTGK